MGARGPRPTPTKILQARDSWRAADRADADGPLFPVDEPSCPDWLPKEAKAEWRRIVGQLLTAGLLSKANRATLTAYCLAWAEVHEAESALKKTGRVIKGKKSPWVAIARAARLELRQLAAEFGMTPASAGKVSAAAKEPEKKNEEKDKGRFFKTVG